MKCSVLMPTRERPDMAEESILSLGEGDFEVLMYVDDDDKDLLQYKDLEKKYEHVKLFVRPRLTYYRFHEMINQLAEHAEGEWLLLWNDDAFMKGEWISKLDDYDHKKVNVMRWGDSENKLNLFPAISRKMYELQGYYSMSPHCDSWAMDISLELGCQRWVHGMEIEHWRDYPELKDDTKKHTMTAYSTTVPQHSSQVVQDELKRAIELLGPHV